MPQRKRSDEAGDHPDERWAAACPCGEVPPPCHDGHHTVWMGGVNRSMFRPLDDAKDSS